MTNGHQWAIVLAAGEGSRLHSITTDDHGISVPKQYCTLFGRHSMLHGALERVSPLIPREKTLIVVSASHQLWWKTELENYPVANIIVQPSNKGTAAGILLPLLNILSRDRKADILIIPSDHYIQWELVIQNAFHHAIAAIQEQDQRTVLLGMTPDTMDAEYGWIIPTSHRDGYVYPVRSFVEKPEASIALNLLAQGGLWNSFMLAASGTALIQLYRRILPNLLNSFIVALSNNGWTPATLTQLYEKIESFDFSRHLLEAASPYLWTLPVPPCGWTDLGTPARVLRCLSCIPSSRRTSGSNSDFLGGPGFRLSPE